MTDEETAEIRAAAKVYARMPASEALSLIEREDRVPLLQVVCEDRRLKVRDAANRRLWILSTRGPAVAEAEPKVVRAGSRGGKTAKR